MSTYVLSLRWPDINLDSIFITLDFSFFSRILVRVEVLARDGLSILWDMKDLLETGPSKIRLLLLDLGLLNFLRGSITELKDSNFLGSLCDF